MANYPTVAVRQTGAGRGLRTRAENVILPGDHDVKRLVISFSQTRIQRIHESFALMMVAAVFYLDRQKFVFDPAGSSIRLQICAPEIFLVLNAAESYHWSPSLGRLVHGNTKCHRGR